MKYYKKGSSEAWRRVWRVIEEGKYRKKQIEEYYYIDGFPRTLKQLEYYQYFRFINNLIKSDNKTIKSLEVGCGRGTISLYFRKKNKFDVTSLDILESALKIAKRSFLVENAKGEFVVADVEHLPFKDNNFDIVFTIGLLEHFENITIPITEMIRVLKHDSLFVSVNFPAKFSLDKMFGYPFRYVFKLILRLINLRLYKIRRWLSKRKLEQKQSGIYYNNYNYKYYKRIGRLLGLINIKCIGANPLIFLRPFPKIFERFFVLFYQIMFTNEGNFIVGNKLGSCNILYGRKK